MLWQFPGRDVVPVMPEKRSGDTHQAQDLLAHGIAPGSVPYNTDRSESVVVKKQPDYPGFKNKAERTRRRGEEVGGRGEWSRGHHSTCP